MGMHWAVFVSHGRGPIQMFKCELPVGPSFRSFSLACWSLSAWLPLCPVAHPARMLRLIARQSAECLACQRVTLIKSDQCLLQQGNCRFDGVRPQISSTQIVSRHVCRGDRSRKSLHARSRTRSKIGIARDSSLLKVDGSPSNGSLPTCNHRQHPAFVKPRIAASLGDRVLYLSESSVNGSHVAS